jgi:hypothetical protein
MYSHDIQGHHFTDYWNNNKYKTDTKFIIKSLIRIKWIFKLYFLYGFNVNKWLNFQQFINKYLL